jgi:hypothetical protein
LILSAQALELCDAFAKALRSGNGGGGVELVSLNVAIAEPPTYIHVVSECGHVGAGLLQGSRELLCLLSKARDLGL